MENVINAEYHIVLPLLILGYLLDPCKLIICVFTVFSNSNKVFHRKLIVVLPQTPRGRLF
jgi:hypothetical protein